MKKEKARNPWAAILFLAYCALMVYLLFFRNRAAVEGLPYWEQVQSNYNLAFGRTIRNFWDILARREYYMEKWGAANIYRTHAQTAFVNLVGNVVMFIPFGVFLPMMWKGLQRVWKALPVGLLTIMLVEVCQLFVLRGTCDVDDVVLNMAGITLGYGLWRLGKTCRKRK